MAGSYERGNEPSGSIECGGISWLAIVLVFRDWIYSLEMVPNTIGTFQRHHVLSKRPYTDSPLKQLHIPEETNPHHYSAFTVTMTSDGIKISLLPVLLHESRFNFTIIRVESQKTAFVSYSTPRVPNCMNTSAIPYSPPPPSRTEQCKPDMQTPFSANDDSSLVVCDVLRDGRARDCNWQIPTSLNRHHDLLPQTNATNRTCQSIHLFPIHTHTQCTAILFAVSVTSNDRV
jgi:hypothetical protein